MKSAISLIEIIFKLVFVESELFLVILILYSVCVPSAEVTVITNLFNPSINPVVLVC